MENWKAYADRGAVDRCFFNLRHVHFDVYFHRVGKGHSRGDISQSTGLLYKRFQQIRYDTILDDEIFGVSMGQKQLLTIARVILADPAILILDEATSSVDTRTEVEIQQAMNALMRGRTSFVIAHRLSTIRDADMILVMRNGTIVEQGTHEQLLIRKGVYAELYNSQFVSQAP